MNRDRESARVGSGDGSRAFRIGAVGACRATSSYRAQRTFDPPAKPPRPKLILADERNAGTSSRRAQARTARSWTIPFPASRPPPGAGRGGAGGTEPVPDHVHQRPRTGEPRGIVQRAARYLPRAQQLQSEHWPRGTRVPADPRLVQPPRRAGFEVGRANVFIAPWIRGAWRHCCHGPARFDPGERACRFVNDETRQCCSAMAPDGVTA